MDKPYVDWHFRKDLFSSARRFYSCEMLLVFFESLDKSLELESGNNICFTKNLSSVYFSRFLGEHKNLH